MKSIKVKGSNKNIVDAVVSEQQLEYANRDISLEELKNDKLKEVASIFKLHVKVDIFDQLNHLNPNVETTEENKNKMFEFEALKAKHEEVKKSIRACETKEELELTNINLL